MYQPELHRARHRGRQVPRPMHSVRQVASNGGRGLARVSAEADGRLPTGARGSGRIHGYVRTRFVHAAGPRGNIQF